jgi:hypothetical protein
MEEFIKGALDKIKASYPEATILYEYNILSSTHFIKVTPIEFYNDESFLDLEFELIDAFNALELDESLCFITEDSLIDLKNPSIVIKPEAEPVSLLKDVLFESVFDGKTQLKPDWCSDILNPERTRGLEFISSDNSWYSTTNYMSEDCIVQESVLSLNNDISDNIDDFSNSMKQKMAA